MIVSKELTKEPSIDSVFPDPGEPVLLDTTLRDGEQSPGLYFTVNEKICIAEKLDRLGVTIIEAGIPCMGIEEREVFRILLGLNLKAEILAWNRLVSEDVKTSLEAGIRSIHVSICTSPLQLTRKIRKDITWVLKRMEEVIGFAVREGLTVSFGAEDASRTDPELLRGIFRHARELGAVRVRYADTLGIMTPGKTSEIVGMLTKDLMIPLDFHAHNDFGLATANALCAWKAGAQIISCSLLGLGERAGNTPLEEFVGSTCFLEKRFQHFDFLALRELCEMISGYSGRPMASYKPLFGREIFSHESGLHVDGLIKDAATYEFFPPEKVGGERKFIIGKHSGRSALKYFASRYRRKLSDGQAEIFLMNLRARMAIDKDIDAQYTFDSFIKQLDIV